MLLGLDVLSRLGAQIDLENLTLSGEEFQVSMKSVRQTILLPGSLKPIQLGYDLRVPPKTEVVVSLKVPEVEGEGMLYFEPEEDLPVLVPRSVYCKGAKVPMCFINDSPHSQQLKKGSILGYLGTMSEEDILQEDREDRGPSP